MMKTINTDSARYLEQSSSFSIKQSVQPKVFLGSSLLCLLLLFLQFQADNQLQFTSSDSTAKKTSTSNSSNYLIAANTTTTDNNFPIKKRNARHPENPLDYNIFIIHYHKSGHDIADSLLKLLGREGKGAGLRTTLDKTKRKHIREIRKRTHDMNTTCPRGHYPCGYASILAAPDFFCSNDVLDEVLKPVSALPTDSNLGRMNSQSTACGTKIIHMVRDPFEMALSNYFYHSQSPTPEDWVEKDYNPCDTEYYHHGRHTNTTNLDLILPTLSMSRSRIDAVDSLCHSLFQNPETKKASFYDHLLTLEGIDGLRLSTSRQIIGGGGKTEHAGGDLLRMTNNAVKLHQLINHNEGNGTSRSLQIMTTFMSQWVHDPYNTTMAALDFVLGDKLPQNRKQAVAIEYQQQYEEKASGEHIHITSTKEFVRDRKKELMDLLKVDHVLAPVLNEMQELLRLHS